MIFSVLRVNHVEVAAVVFCHPNLASSDTSFPVKERVEAFQGYIFGNVVRAAQYRNSQCSSADSVGVKVETPFGGMDGRYTSLECVGQ